jgi:uncharacterized membrane protein
VRCSWAAQGQWSRILSMVLVMAILGAIGTLGYVIAKPKVDERFSQFYILGPEGRAENYPREVALKQSTSVILGIANHEHQPTIYTVNIMIDEQEVDTLGPIALGHKEVWEREVSFMPLKLGPHQKLEFWLYKGGSEEVYLKTHLWIDVKEE